MSAYFNELYGNNLLYLGLIDFIMIVRSSLHSLATAVQCDVSGPLLRRLIEQVFIYYLRAACRFRNLPRPADIVAVPSIAHHGVFQVCPPTSRPGH